PAPRRDKLVRPADPFEALSGTVSGFVLEDEDQYAADPAQSPWATGDDSWRPEAGDTARSTRLVSPRPQTDHWSPPTPQPRYGMAHRRGTMTDLSLQANPQLDLPRLRPALAARMSDQALF